MRCRWGVSSAKIVFKCLFRFSTVILLFSRRFPPLTWRSSAREGDPGRGYSHSPVLVLSTSRSSFPCRTPPRQRRRVRTQHPIEIAWAIAPAALCLRLLAMSEDTHLFECSMPLSTVIPRCFFPFCFSVNRTRLLLPISIFSFFMRFFTFIGKVKKTQETW